MNGNFDFDKATYPYGAMSNGDGTAKIAHMPTLTEVYKKSVPTPVANEVALELNQLYYAQKNPHGADIPALIRGAARHALDENKISGAVYSQVIDQLNG